ncbi:MAG TPA: SGNH/GDSL hydrolase family protein [Stellaceae bacterium]|nr:SGNH/GDSL hydrolase family protein [Stellaceae bacterium]
MSALARLAAVAFALPLAFVASAFAASPHCAAPARFLSVGAALPHAGTRLTEGKSLTILAIGSSSTAGFGASTPAASYPSRLERDLRADFDGVEIRVINRGVGGQDVPEELSRLARDIAEEHPQLVIWQVGTNAVLRRDDVAADERLIERGVALVKAQGIDLILMDLQYAPRVLPRRSYGRMEAAIAEIARRSGVGFFRRFAMMEYWTTHREYGPADLIGRDGLHMTDFSYGCLGDILARALVLEWRSTIAGRRAAPIQAAAVKLDRSAPPRH